MDNQTSSITASSPSIQVTGEAVRWRQSQSSNLQLKKHSEAIKDTLETTDGDSSSRLDGRQPAISKESSEQSDVDSGDSGDILDISG